MNENASDSENTSKAPETAKPKGVRKAGKKAKTAKKEYEDALRLEFFDF